MIIRDIDAKWGGSTHDAFMFTASNMATRLQRGDFGNNWLLGDSGYGCKPYLLTPLLNTQSHAERRYNRPYSRS